MARRTAASSAARPNRRHLVRWTPEMDSRLLLTIQSQCNIQNIQIPWDNIGRAMGEHITGGACIQHLAKLRSRMVSLGLPVPLPLRRGGGVGTLSGPSTSRARQPVVSPTTVQKARTRASKRRAPVKVAAEDSEEVEEDPDSDSDTEYGKPLAKRKRTSGTKRSSTPGVDEANDEVVGQEIEEEVNDDGASQVASGASFLSLSEGNKAKKHCTLEEKNKPSLVVTLGVRRNGHAFVKKQTAEESTNTENSSEAETEIEDPITAKERNTGSQLAADARMAETNDNTTLSSSIRSHDASLPGTHLPTLSAFGINSPVFGPNSGETSGNIATIHGAPPATHTNFDEPHFLDDFSQTEMLDHPTGTVRPVSYTDKHSAIGNNHFFGNDGTSYALPHFDVAHFDGFHYSNQTDDPNLSGSALPHLSNAFQPVGDFHNQCTMVNTTANQTPAFGANQDNLSWPVLYPQTTNLDGEGGYFDMAYNSGYIDHKYAP